MFKQFPSREKKFVALKVVKSAAHYTETALDEIKLLKCVSNKLKIANIQIFSFLPSFELRRRRHAQNQCNQYHKWTEIF